MKLFQRALAYSLGLLAVTVASAQEVPEAFPALDPSPSPSPSPSSTPRPANDWRVQLFNGDDIQYVICNGQKMSPAAGYRQFVEVNLNNCLVPGRRNEFEIILYNAGGGYTFGYRILKNGVVAVTETGNKAERQCGQAGVAGCDSTSPARTGVIRRWKYYFKI